MAKIEAGAEQMQVFMEQIHTTRRHYFDALARLMAEEQAMRDQGIGSESADLLDDLLDAFNTFRAGATELFTGAIASLKKRPSKTRGESESSASAHNAEHGHF